MFKIDDDTVEQVKEAVNSRFNDAFSVSSVVVFKKDYNEITAGTKAIVVERQKDYYALAVKGNYIERVPKSFLKIIK